MLRTWTGCARALLHDTPHEYTHARRVVALRVAGDGAPRVVTLSRLECRVRRAARRVREDKVDIAAAALRAPRHRLRPPLSPPQPPPAEQLEKASPTQDTAVCFHFAGCSRGVLDGSVNGESAPCRRAAALFKLE